MSKSLQIRTKFENATIRVTTLPVTMSGRRIFGRLGRGDQGLGNLMLGQSGTTTLISSSLLNRHVMIQVHATND